MAMVGNVDMTTHCDQPICDVPMLVVSAREYLLLELAQAQLGVKLVVHVVKELEGWSRQHNEVSPHFSVVSR
jgi:hypothetical protein